MNFDSRVSSSSWPSRAARAACRGLFLVASCLACLGAKAADPGDRMPASPVSLAAEILPDDKPARPPYQLARYDLGEKPSVPTDKSELPSLKKLRDLAAARQQRLENAWRETKIARPRDLSRVEMAEWTLLAYAFGEEPLERALEAAAAAGPNAQCRLARLLLAECRFEAAVKLLAAVADLPGEDAKAREIAQQALALLVRHQAERDVLKKYAKLMPLQFDLPGYLTRRERDPAVRRFIAGVRHTTNVRVPDDSLAGASDRKDKDREEPFTLSEESLDVSVFTSGEQDWDVVGRGTVRQRPQARSVYDLGRPYLTLASGEFLLACADDYLSGDRVTVTLRSAFHGPIAFRLYRYGQQKEWQEAAPAQLASHKPERAWTNEFLSLRENNRTGEKDWKVSMDGLREGYYLLAAEVRGAPLLAVCKFCVSHVAVYVRAAGNQAVVIAVDRRNGAPVANLPLRLITTGKPDMDRLKDRARNDSDEQFARGFHGEKAAEIRQSGPAVEPNDDDPFGAEPDRTGDPLVDFGVNTNGRQQARVRTAERSRVSDDDSRQAAVEVPLRQQMREAADYARGLEARERRPDLTQAYNLRTGADGSAQVPLKLDRPEYGCQLRVERTAEDLDAGPLSHTEVAYQEPQPANDREKAIVWLAQPIQRPGGVVQFKGILRSFDGLRIADHRPADQRPVSVQVQGRGGKLWEGRCQLSAVGTFCGQFTVPQGANAGPCFFLVDGQRVTPYYPLTVEEFRLSPLRVTIETAQDVYAGGEPAQGQVVVEHFTGKPGAGADVEVALETASRQQEEGSKLPVIAGKADARGCFPFVLPLPATGDERSFRIRATVRDVSGQSHTETRLIGIRSDAFRVEVTPSPHSVTAGSMVELKVCATRFSGQPVVGAVVIVNGAQQSATTDAQGRASLRIRATLGEKRQTLEPPQVTVIAGGKVVRAKCYVDVLPHEDSPGESTAETAVAQPARSTIVSLRAPQRIAAGSPLECLIALEGERARRLTLALFLESNRLLSGRVFQVLPGEHRLSIPTQASWAPSVQVTAVLLDGRSAVTECAWCYLNPLEKRLTLEIQTDKREYKPGEACHAVIVATDHRGQAVPGAEISLGVVDEAVYQAREDSTSRMDRLFYEYHLPHCCVGEFDGPLPGPSSLQWLLGPRYAWGYDGCGALDALQGQASLMGRFGGTKASGRSPRLRARAHFATAAHWAPALTTDGHGKAHTTFTFPDNVASWRFTARGVTADTRLGEACVTRRTLLPLAVDVTVPRGFRVGDRIELPVVLRNHKEVERLVEGTTRVDAGEERPWQPLRLPALGDGRLTIPLTAASQTPLTVFASVLDKTHGDADAVRRQIVPLPRDPLVVRTYSGPLDAAATVRLDLAAEASAPASAKAIRLLVRREAGLVGPVQSALDELVQYPYGCVEQTMSRFLPAVVAARIMDSAGIRFPGAERLPKALAEGLGRLADHQHRDGGWGWWKDDPTNDFMTAYVLEGLAQCCRLQRPLPAGLAKQAKRYLLERLQRGVLQGRRPESIGEVDLAVYAAHALAAMQSYQLDTSGEALDMDSPLILRTALQASEERSAALGLLDQVLLADAWRLLGDERRAANRLDQFAAQAKPQYGDRRSIIAAGAILELGAALRRDDPRWRHLAKQLVAARRDSAWGDTLTTAAAVRGLAAVLTAPRTQESPVKVRVDGSDAGTLSEKNGNRLELTLNRAGTLTLHPEKLPCDDFYVVRAEGFLPKPPGPGAAPAVRLHTRLFSTQPTRREVVPDRSGRVEIARGVTYEMLVAVELKQAVSHSRLTVPRPCGLELVRPIQTVGGIVAVEGRDDAIHAFVEYWNAGAHEVRFLVRAEVSGSVHAPPPELAPMYGDSLSTAVVGPTRWDIKD